MPLAQGPFDVKVTPVAGAATDAVGRMSVEKQFHGELAASSRFEMLTARTSVKESGAYVALEPVTGSLAGREGSFILQHCAVMDRGQPTLAITVVPDSGTGALAGLRGTMAIDIAPGGAHAYRLEYTLPGA